MRISETILHRHVVEDRLGLRTVDVTLTFIIGARSGISGFRLQFQDVEKSGVVVVVNRRELAGVPVDLWSLEPCTQ